MFRRLFFSFSLLFCFMFLGSTVFASESNIENGKNILFKADEITDTQLLKLKKLKGEHPNIELGQFSNLALQQKLSVTLSTENSLNSISDEVSSDELSGLVQLLEISEDENGVIEEVYSLNYEVDVVEDEDGNFQLMNSQSRRGTDATGSVRATSSSYFAVRYDSNGVHHARFTRGNGQWTVLQPGVDLSNRSVVYGTIGPGSFGSTSGQRRTIAPSVNSWSVTAPSSWNPAATNSTGAVIGSTATVRLTGRTTSTLQLLNQWGR